MKRFSFRCVFWMTATLLLWSAPAVSQDTAQDASKTFSKDKLEQLVAPIALYTDGLVAQIMMASTYPLQVVEADRWVKQNPKLQGEALQKAVEKEKWDPSVQSLVFFPEVLDRMSSNLEWTQDLGDAVLADQKAVMDAVQRMRRYAYDAGNLKTNDQQTVEVESTVIKIEPATQVVYVPAYNPTVVYSTYWGPPVYYYPIYSRPPAYWYPPGYVASNVVSFGVGVAVGAALWGGCDWHGHSLYHHYGNVNINVNRVNINNSNTNINTNINKNNINTNINKNNINTSNKIQKWEHNPQNRGGVRYQDAATRQKYDDRRMESTRQARIDRDTARGFDGAGTRDLQRPSSRDVQRPQPREMPKSSTRDMQRPQRPSGNSSAFKVGDRNFDRQAFDRGSFSRGGFSRGGGGFGGRGR
jgi:uncharacterized membrane protein YgcG